MIKLTEKKWEVLHAKLTDEHPRSVMLITYKMKEVLGFSVRRHHEWTGQNDSWKNETAICLDFYNDSLETWFRLKYGEML